MKYVPSEGSSLISGGGSNASTDPIIYARVERVITSPNDDGYKERGGLKSLNGIFFTFLQNTSAGSDQPTTTTDFAYPSSLNLLHIPIPGEVVQIITLPNPDTSTMTLSRKYFYINVVNYWNHPKDGLFFNLYKPLVLNTNHRKFKLNPLTISEGDTIIQGRYGQYVRFTTEGTEVNPLINISAGRLYTRPENYPVTSDINKDLSTIELHTKGTSLLKSANTFTKSHRKESTPEATNAYTGEQILINTGRAVINAKEDSVLVSAKKSISTSAATINQEASKEICQESPKIFLGAGAMNSTTPEPILLGNKTEQLLIEVLDQLIDLADSLKLATTVSGEQLPIVNQKGAKISIILKSIKSRLNPKGVSELKSKKSFVE